MDSQQEFGNISKKRQTLLFGIFFLCLATLGIIFFLVLNKSSWENNPSPITPSQPPLISTNNNQANISLKDTTREINVLSTIRNAQDGSFRFSSRPGDLMLRQETNLTYEIKGDFEVQLGMRTYGIKFPEKKKYGRIYFLNSTYRQPLDGLVIGINQFNKLTVMFSHRSMNESSYPITGEEAPSSGNLRIRFSGVNSGKGETVTFYNGDTGEQIKQIQLQYPLFDGKLHVNFEVVNTEGDPQGAQMVVSHFTIVPMQLDTLKRMSK